ncbi:MAG: YqgE/AlgH family protein [Kistimonas sp.]|nr:YqgE/AlgH family protein [Kistimonas sp.]
MTSIQTTLRNSLLLAMPHISDPRFCGTVIYLCAHDERGAMGLIINRPLNINTTDLFACIDVPGKRMQRKKNCPERIFMGGPVSMGSSFVLHSYTGALDPDSSLAITGDIALTSSRSILADIALDKGPSQVLISLGCSSWGPGQLEQELCNNSWLNGAADKTLLFSTPAEQRLEVAAARVGVTLSLISTEAGHA